MTQLWIPPAAVAKHKATSQQFTAALMAEAEVVGRVRHFNREIQKIDPYIEIVKADDNARHPALRPGYYHLVRRPPVGMPAIVAHEGPNGEFRDLDSGILQTLRNSDMWNSERQRDRDKRIKAAQRAQERQEEREREERVDEIMDRFKSRSGTSVLLPRGI